VDVYRSKIALVLFFRTDVSKLECGTGFGLLGVDADSHPDYISYHILSQVVLDQNGREASISELADATGLSVKRLKHIQKFQHPIAEGTITARMAESEDGGFMPAVEQDGGSSWLEFVYDDLDPINQKIMEWTLGLHGQKPLSNRQVAAKLRISPGAVSQRKAHIQGILDQEQQLSPFYG